MYKDASYFSSYKWPYCLLYHYILRDHPAAHPPSSYIRLDADL